MKKILIAILVLAMTFALVACGAKQESKPKDDDTENSGSNSGSDSGSENTENGEASEKIGFAKEGEYIVFKVSGSFKLTESAWMGIVPAGVEYKTEAEADEVDIHYEYPWEYAEMKAGDDYLFKFPTDSIESIEDGNYIMVLCDDDDEGAIVLQFPITINGAEITADLSKLKVN